MIQWKTYTVRYNNTSWSYVNGIGQPIIFSFNWYEDRSNSHELSVFTCDDIERLLR